MAGYYYSDTGGNYYFVYWGNSTADCKTIFLYNICN